MYKINTFYNKYKCINFIVKIKQKSNSYKGNIKLAYCYQNGYTRKNVNLNATNFTYELSISKYV